MMIQTVHADGVTAVTTSGAQPCTIHDVTKTDSVTEKGDFEQQTKQQLLAWWHIMIGIANQLVFGEARLTIQIGLGSATLASGTCATVHDRLLMRNKRFKA